MDLKKLYLRLEPPRMGVLRFVLEGYDNLATMTTINRTGAIILLRYHQGNRKILEEILDAVTRQRHPLMTSRDHECLY